MNVKDALKEKPVEHNKIKKFFKVILGIISAIFIGAVGSGIWQIVLHPTLVYIGNFINSVLSTISTSYSNSIYVLATQINGIGYFGGFIVIWCIIIILSILLMYNTDPIAFKRELKSRNMKICLILLLIMGIIAGVIKSSIREIKLYSTKQMEIIRPYIGEKQYFTLCSDYLRIKNKEDFDNFLKNLYAHADAIAKDIAKHDPKAKPFKIEKFKE